MRATGSVPISTGSVTKAYKVISCTFTLAFTYVAILPKCASGKDKCRCNFSNDAPTLGSAQIVTGSGTVSYS